MVGKIKRCLELDGGQSIEYLLEDLEDEYADFLIMHYRGVVSDFLFFFFWFIVFLFSFVLIGIVRLI